MLEHLRRISRNPKAILAVIAVISVIAIFWPHAQPVPVVTPDQAPPPAVPTPAPSKAVQDRATEVLELFNPSDQSLTHQLNETALSQQVEQVMATSYILAHCKLMDDDEYRDNFRALIVFAQHSGLAPDAMTAEAKVRQLAQSAAVSYSLLYSRTNCMDPQLLTSQRQMTNWRKIYLHE
jgi:hypothetical protein